MDGWLSDAEIAGLTGDVPVDYSAFDTGGGDFYTNEYVSPEEIANYYPTPEEYYPTPEEAISPGYSDYVISPYEDYGVSPYDVAAMGAEQAGFGGIPQLSEEEIASLQMGTPDTSAFGQPEGTGQLSEAEIRSLSMSPREVSKAVEASSFGGADPTIMGVLSKLGSQLAKGDLKAWSSLLKSGADVYTSMRAIRAANEAAKRTNEQAAANAARFNMALPQFQFQRQQLAAPSDLLTAGQRPGGLQWFTPGQFKQMAKGGSVDETDDDGWLERLMFAIRQRMPRPEVTGRGLASQGAVNVMNRPYMLYRAEQEGVGEPVLPYNEWVLQQRRGKAAGGRLVEGSSGGQDDDVPARLSPGEYVFDADSVSALGDGNNSAGSQKLDELRRKLRAHKRKAPPDKIPPKAKKPEEYLSKGK